MKKYRIKPFGRNEEIGRVVFQDDGQVFMKLNIAPKQIYILDLIDNTDFFNDVKQVFPNVENEKAKPQPRYWTGDYSGATTTNGNSIACALGINS